jgi:acyl dehydratase
MGSGVTMAFDPQRLRDWRFEPIRQSYSERDAIFYALGVGLPQDALDAAELDFLVEDRLKVLPTFAVTLASPGMWVRDPELGIDWVKILHAAQSAIFHQPLPPEADVISEARVKSLHDRGAEKGSVCVLERTIRDADSGAAYCTLDQTIFLRGNGGFGGGPAPRAPLPAMPDRAPDVAASVATSPRAALIYRLSGDLNPLHADPQVARMAGFDKPILHGLASYGTAGAVVLRHFCDGDPALLKSLSLRFAGIVMPGDVLDIGMWREEDTVLFAVKVGDRTVIDQGVALVA